MRSGLGNNFDQLSRVTVGAWEPSSASGLRWLLDPNSFAYTDAGTTLAVNDGDVVYRQRDFYSGSLYVENSDVAKRLVLKIGANGKRALLADGANDVLASPSNITISSGEVTLFSLVRCAWQTSKYRPLIGVNYNGTTGVAINTSGGASADWLDKSIMGVGNGYSSGRAPRNMSAYGSITSDTWHTVIVVLSSSRSESYLDGSLLTPSGSSVGAVPSLTAALSICGSAATSDFSNGYHGPQGLYDAALSVGDVAKLHTWLAARALT